MAAASAAIDWDMAKLAESTLGAARPPLPRAEPSGGGARQSQPGKGKGKGRPGGYAAAERPGGGAAPRTGADTSSGEKRRYEDYRSDDAKRRRHR